MNPLILRESTIADLSTGRVVAMVRDENPLRTEPRLPEKLLTPAMVSWSGWATDEHEPWAVARDFRTWSREAWESLGRWCDGLAPQLRERGIELWLRPHARHILADPQSCLSFLTRRQGEPIRIILEPAAFLTTEMLNRTEDHLERAFSALGSHPGVAAVLLTNVDRASGADDSPLSIVPLHRGVLDSRVLLGLWRQHAPESIPVVLLAEGIEEQRRLIDTR